MRAVVTGAAGFIGSHLVEALVAAGNDVVGVDCFTDYYPPSRKRENLEAVGADPSFELIEADLCVVDPAEFLSPGDVVFHLAAQPGVRRSWGREFETYAQQNILATQRVLEASKAAGVERLVFASSSSIYGDAESYPTSEDAKPAPVSPYGITKLAAEHLCLLYARKFAVPAIALRYFTVYGPRQRPDMAFHRFIEAALAQEPVEVFGDGRQVRDFTYVGDVVAATIAAATRGRSGSVYNVAGGSETTVLAVIEKLEQLLGRPIEVEHRPAVTGDARRTGADAGRAREELGLEAAVPLDRGLRAQLDARLGAEAPG